MSNYLILYLFRIEKEGISAEFHLTFNAVTAVDVPIDDTLERGPTRIYEPQISADGM